MSIYVWFIMLVRAPLTIASTTCLSLVVIDPEFADSNLTYFRVTKHVFVVAFHLGISTPPRNLETSGTPC